MVHTALIVGHAIAGLIALIFGCLVLRPPASIRSVAFRVYAVALAAMLVLVTAVVLVDWPDLSGGQRVTFAALIALGVYTVLRGAQALRALRRQPAGWRARYVDHVGFTVISLFDGFTIVAAIDLGAPLPVVIITGVLGVVVGILAINRVKARLDATGPVAARAPGGVRVDP